MKVELEERNSPRFVLLPAEPHPDRLLHHDTGPGPVQDLILHCGRRERTEETCKPPDIRHSSLLLPHPSPDSTSPRSGRVVRTQR